MTRRTVLLDCDGPLSDFYGGYLGVVANVTGRHFTREQVTHFDIGESIGLTPEESGAVERWIGQSRGWCEALDVMPGAIEGVRALREIADVYIVTSPWDSCPTWESERKAWLLRHFGIPHRRVAHVADKHLAWGDVFVDDKTEHVVAWDAKWPHGRAVRWVTPHNRLDPPVVIEADNWSGLVRFVEQVRP